MQADVLAARFEYDRPQLRAMSYRMLGSIEDAEDAIQRAWLKAARSDLDAVSNLSGWFARVVSRECLDMLRARRRRSELPLHEELGTAEQDGAPSAEEEVIRTEAVSRALLVVLDRLSPAQRVAFVLHDLFAVPFDEIADILDRTPTAAKKLASKARLQIGPHKPRSPDESRGADIELVDAFLNASRHGDIATLLEILAPGVIRRADVSLIPAGVSTEVQGARAVAEETRVFAPRARVGAVVMIDGFPGIVIAPGGHLRAILRVTIADGQIHQIQLSDPVHLPDVDITLATLPLGVRRDKRDEGE
jgi:RNA polymerase sigma-70 factor, ECF subfamily